ncbi:MAG: hypothetical protein LAN71_07290 [Acidobacteriia bacterium]|nr:hypothetical protein [Terriglobia bacterium]
MSYAQRRRFLLLLFLAGLLLIGIAANATTFLRLDFAELARASSAIARLRCLSAESRLENGQIWTDSRFAVLETVKGNLSPILTVRTPGGSAAGITAHVDGVPRFRPGEEVFLFLIAQPGEPWKILGWAQGTFRIARGPRGGSERLTQDSAALPVYDPARREFRAEGLRNVTVDEFRARVQHALAAAP